MKYATSLAPAAVLVLAGSQASALVLPPSGPHVNAPNGAVVMKERQIFHPDEAQASHQPNVVVNRATQVATAPSEFESELLGLGPVEHLSARAEADPIDLSMFQPWLEVPQSANPAPQPSEVSINWGEPINLGPGTVPVNRREAVGENADTGAPISPQPSEVSINYGQPINYGPGTIPVNRREAASTYEEPGNVNSPQSSDVPTKHGQLTNFGLGPIIAKRAIIDELGA